MIGKNVAVFAENPRSFLRPFSRAGQRMFKLCCLALMLTVLHCPRANSQTIDDGIMMRKSNLFTGSLYTYDWWDEYWEGGLKRVNGNIGTITTQAVTWSGNYGITDRINVIVNVPYVWTNASQGVLKSMSGFQDITIAAKYNFFQRPIGQNGSFRAIGVVSGGIPLTSYTPDFLPLSIGSASKRIAGRFTAFYQNSRGWFLNGSTAYTWRSNVTLDRPYYYTNGQLFLSNEVAMPNVFDYTVSGGYLKHHIMIPFVFSQQRVQGGGDIRRQDIPFVSNRMNFSRIGGFAMTPLPFMGSNPLRVRVGFDYILDGRNVGQSKTFTVGLLYTLNFSGRPNQ